MIKQRSKALWGLISISALLAILAGGFGGFGRTANSKGIAGSAATAAAQVGMRPWTAVATTGAVDESSLGIFAFNPVAIMASGAVSSVGYLPASPSLAPIIVRYNVTNTFDNNANPNMPGWTILELGSFAPPGTAVSATAFRIRTCPNGVSTGVQELLCTATNANLQIPNTCVRCQFPTAQGPVDFGTYVYYVELVLRRSSATTAGPLAHTLRIY